MTGNNGSVPAFQAETELIFNVQECLNCWSKHGVPNERQVKAWDRFYGTYSPLMRRIAASFHLSKTDEDDCCQEIWQKLLQILPKLKFDRARGPFRNWLTTVGHRHAWRFVQEHLRQPAKNAFHRSEGWGNISTKVAGAEEELQQKEKVRLIQQLLQQLRSRLSFPSYQVFHMRWMEGLPFHEIAERLNVTPEQARWRHHRAKKKAAELLTLTVRSDLD